MCCLTPVACQPSGPKLDPVEVVVLMEGTPLWGVEVTLYPVSPELKSAHCYPHGRCDEKGVARLMMLQPDDGAPAGE